ncbi:MAG: PilZ domain-containing protein [Brevinematia bacterium]
MFNSESVINILKFFVSSNKNIILIVDDLKINTKIIDVNDIYFYLDIPFELDIQKFPYGISCLIPYGKDLFFFNSEIIDIQENKAKIVLPATIVKKHSRDYERYNVEGILFASLNVVKEIDNKDLIDRFPSSIRLTFQEILGKASFEEILEKILNLILEKFDHAIFIDKLSQLSWLRFCRYNKTGLVLPNVNSKTFLNPFKVYGFSTYGTFLEPQKRNILDSEVKFFLNYHISKGFVSYIYLPIFIVDTLIGYIMIASKKPLELDNFDNILKIMELLGFIDLIEKIFCYNRFFVLNEYRDYLIPVVDISFGGIKIKIDKHIAYFINVGDTVKVYFKIGTKFFEFIGEVIRIGYENDSFISAIKFFNIDKSEFSFIKKWFSNFER